MGKKKKQKAIMVVYGKDEVGIVYNVTKILYENNVNILNIKQTIADEYFNMMCILDVAYAKPLNKIKSDLEKYAKKGALNINFQLEDAFTTMHVL